MGDGMGRGQANGMPAKKSQSTSKLSAKGKHWIAQHEFCDNLAPASENYIELDLNYIELH